MDGDGRRGKSGDKVQDGVLNAATGFTGCDKRFWPIDSNSNKRYLHTIPALIRAMDKPKREGNAIQEQSSARDVSSSV